MAEKDNTMNFINSWKKGNKKEKYEITFRLGTLTLLEIKACLFCEEGCSKKRYRVILLNFGFEL
tara:strand:- start:2040 stop:2231 length:192 start_codon:yes stop_codon:yes gene_type:complete